MKKQGVPLKYKKQLMEVLASIPRLTHLQFCQHLVFLHQCLNSKEISLLDIVSQSSPRTYQQNERHLKSITENMENGRLHNTYSFELELYHHIQNGDVNALQDFLSSIPLDLTEGKFARTPLRHVKNLFIGTATKIEMLGAIPGGMDVEKAYQLTELYIQECENLQSHEEIFALLYSRNALKKLFTIYPSSPFTIFRVTANSAVVDAPTVKIGMLHTIQRTCSKIR